MPPVLIAGLLRSKRRAPDQVRSVGIFGCTPIGDTILASGIARDIKRAIPDCSVTAFISPSAWSLCAVLEGFDDSVAVDLTKPLDAGRVLWRHKTDILIDVMPWARMTALLAAASPAEFTVGFRTQRQYRHYAYDAAVDHRALCHEIENYRALLQPLGVKGQLLPKVRDASLPRVGGSAHEVILHPWASGYRSEMREWPLVNWAAVAGRLIGDGCTIAITGGASDRARADKLRRLIGSPDATTVLAGSADLLQTAGRLASAALLISVNTGTMHLAAAIGTKMIALHGPTNPLRWGPLNPDAVVLGPDAAQGGAYLHLGFEYPPNVPDCMSLISTADVLAHARRLLSSQPACVQAAD